MTDTRQIASELDFEAAEVNILGEIIATLGELLSPLTDNENPNETEMSYIYMRRKMVSAVLGCALERAGTIEKRLREQSEELFDKAQEVTA